LCDPQPPKEKKRPRAFHSRIRSYFWRQGGEKERRRIFLSPDIRCIDSIKERKKGEKEKKERLHRQSFLCSSGTGAPAKGEKREGGGEQEKGRSKVVVFKRIRGGGGRKRWYVLPLPKGGKKRRGEGKKKR